MIDDVVLDLLHMEAVETFSNATQGEDNELCVTKLENIGFTTGFRFVEKITKDWQRFKDDLDIMKFVCKEFWSLVFKKQVDNLRTNHQGVYVLLDNKFKFITQISNSKQYIELMPKYLGYTCGLIRGALFNLGITCVVTAEVVAPPTCRFQIQVQRT